MSEHSAEAPKHHENPKESTITLSKDTIYGGAVAVLACLLVLAVFTQGFGVIKAPAQQCPQCQACPTGGNGTNNGTVTGPTQPTSLPTLTVTPGDFAAEGQASASVSWIQFSDYQCPYCARLFLGAEAQAKSTYVQTGKVKFYFRDFPLSFHPHSTDAAMAARCANEQGKFWDMHDKLFTTQANWSGATDVAPTFKGYASDMGLDAAKFATCYDGKAYAAQITADQNAGQGYGVGGTPANFLVIPKSKITLDAVKAAVAAAGEGVELFENANEYVVFIPGAYPYTTFDAVLSKVSY